MIEQLQWAQGWFICFLAHRVQTLKLNTESSVLLQKHMSPITNRQLTVKIARVILPANEHQPNNIEAQASFRDIMNLAADTAVRLKIITSLALPV